MKKLFKPLAFILLASAAMSCSSSDEVIEEQVVDGTRPFVDFEFVPTADPFTFDIVTKAENFKTLEWRFGDDSLGTAATNVHRYATTGDYDASLTAIAESGLTSQKVYVVKLKADSIAKLSAVKTGKENEVKFTVDSKADIASVLWSFDAETKSTALNPVKTYAVGTLNPFTFKLTTKQGSVLEVTKLASTEGVMTEITNLSSVSVSNENGGGPRAAEGSVSLTDANVETKFLTSWPGSFWAQFKFVTPQTVKFYGIGSANDAPTRDPKDWTLQGSNNATTWETIDTRAGIAYNGDYKKMFYYAVKSPKAFLYYRWNVTAHNGDGGFQVSEFRLYK